ncbi:MAG: ABC transporter ATP-binding protein [Anaerolineales bacterium]|nr:ABC transporter ATP-binding protein [Anaerolineales bacterium]
MNSIEVEHLKRIYTTTMGVVKRTIKEVVAVDDLSFSISNGELFGLLGPNGAGKTTTIKMLTTLLIPTAGSARIRGFDIVKDARKVRSTIGFIFGGERGLYWRLSAADNLRYFASLYFVDPEVSRKRIPYLLELVGLQDRAQEKVEGYSRGMKQRLHIARTLLHDPDILFLDEPTIGLDPVGARELRQVIHNLHDDGKTILLTTHYMFEADELCERIAVINKGNLVALDSPQGLKEHVRDMNVLEIEVFGIQQDRIDSIRALPQTDSVSVVDRDQRQLLQIHSVFGSEILPKILAILGTLPTGKVALREPTLEDAYVQLVKEEV